MCGVAKTFLPRERRKPHADERLDIHTAYGSPFDTTDSIDLESGLGSIHSVSGGAKAMPAVASLNYV